MNKLLALLNHKACKALAGFMVVLGGLAVNFCMYPFWHYEPALPESIKKEMM